MTTATLQDPYLAELLVALKALQKGRREVHLPAEWTGYSMRYRYRETFYAITVSQIHAADRESSGMSVTVDGVAQPDQTIRLIDDRQEHTAEVRIEIAAAGDPGDQPAEPVSPDEAAVSTLDSGR